VRQLEEDMAMAARSKAKPGRGHHPFIIALGETRARLRTIVDQISGSSDPLLAAILVLNDARDGRRDRAEALAIAEKTSLQSADPEIAAVFLERWAALSFVVDRREESLALIRRARGLISEDTHPIVEASLLRGEASLAASRGNRVEAMELYDRALALVHSERRPPFLLSYALLLAAQWEEDSVDAEFDALPPTVLPSFRAGIEYCRLVQCVETGRLEAGQATLSALEKDHPGLIGSQERTEGSSKALLVVMRGMPPPPGKAGELVAPTLLLLERRPEESLQAARSLVAAEPVRFLNDPDFLAFSLIRAELACGHGEAAGRLIAARRELGNRHVMDDFFLARVRLLAGDRAQAAAHLAAFLASVERCRADGRLDFELRLSCELSPADVVGLMRRASGRTAAPPPEPPRRVPAEALRGAVRLVGASRALEEVRKSVRLLAPLDVPVLVAGETGTGKELVARALHEESPRAGAPFITVNCGAIAEGLLESEMFGHERGAFTGAERARRGLFEEAGTGTIFLDEIGEISPRLQVSLLRVLETGEIRPVGASRERRVRCRIVAATNADLDALAARGAFRQDLLFRLRRMEVCIPPLRERREDILPLVDHFLSEGRTDGRRPALADDLKRELAGRDWPGNVRELRNLVERLRLLNSDGLSYDLAALSGSETARPPAPSAGEHDAPARAQSSAPARGGMPADADIDRVLGEGRTALRRRQRLRELFARCRHLTRAEVIQLMKISPATATADLKALAADGHIDRVEPSASTRSHFFVLKEAKPQA
jgi:DNA-binding NtrC family response regulator/tetratricopeptide (TPR) repeat protein